MVKKGMVWYDWLAIIFLLIGGVAWGLFGVMRMFGGNAYLLVDKIFGVGFGNIIYIIVGLSALFSIYVLSKIHK